MPWNPDSYRQYQTQRNAPFEDLLALITIRPGMQVIDLGCGTGELTARLADTMPNSAVLGIDTSAAMLAEAFKLARPGLGFRQEKLEDITGQWDLVFSHAALQWVPDHESLLPRIIELIRPGGQLAAQIPSNHSHPVHRLLTETAQEGPFAGVLDGWTRQSPVLPVEEYAGLLFDNGCQNINVSERIYSHVLPDADALLEWARGTALVPYLERLPDDLHSPFIETYRHKLGAHWPAGPVYYAFRRMLVAAQRPIA